MFCLGKGSFYSHACMLIGVRQVLSSQFWSFKGSFKSVCNSVLQIVFTYISIFLTPN